LPLSIILTLEKCLPKSAKLDSRVNKLFQIHEILFLNTSFNMYVCEIIEVRVNRPLETRTRDAIRMFVFYP